MIQLNNVFFLFFFLSEKIVEVNKKKKTVKLWQPTVYFLIYLQQIQQTNNSSTFGYNNYIRLYIFGNSKYNLFKESKTYTMIHI